MNLLKTNNLNSLIPRLRAAAAAFSGKAPSVYMDQLYLGGGLSSSGSTVDQLNAYRGWVYGAVRIISSTAAAGRLRFYTTDKTGKKNYLEKGHPLVDLFRNPNPAMTRWHLWFLTFAWMELTGKAYWLKVRDRMGVVRMLLPLAPNWIKVVPDPSELIKGYIYDHGGKRFAFERSDIVYLRYPDPNNLHNGMGPLQAAAYSYDSDLDMHKYDKSLFKHGGSVKSALQTEQYLDPETAKMLRDEWKRLYGSPENANAVAILHSGLDYKRVQMSPQELDFPELRRLSREEIFAIFGVSEGLLGIVKDVNKTNNIALMDTFIRFTMQAKANMLQEQVDKDLTNEVDENIDTEFELPKAVDALEEHQKMEYRIRNFITSANEERENIGMEPSSWGDKPWMPFSSVQPGTASPVKKTESSMAARHIIVGRDLSDDEKELIWRSFLTIHGPQEKNYSRTMIDVFERQRSEVKLNLKKTLRHVNSFDTRIVRAYDPALVDFVLFSLDEWNARLGTELEPRHAEAMKAAAQKAFVDLGSKGGLDINSPLIQEFLTNKKFELPPQINQLTHDNLRDLLKESFKENLSIDELAQRIDVFFDGQNPMRALRIATTEATCSSNFGILESYRQVGKVSTRAWISERDDKVRVSHYDVERRSLENPVPIDQPFIVSGQAMMHPGDPAGGAAEVVNCRCTTVPMEMNDE